MAGEHGYRALTVLYHRVCDKGEEVFALGRIYREIRIQPSGEALVKLVEHGIAECPAVHRHRHVSGQGSVALAVLGEGDDLSVLFNVRALHNVREQAVLDLTDGFGCDLVIETAGTEFTTRQAIEMVHKGATIVLVGYSKSGEMTLPVSLALDKELTFKTVFRYRHIYPMAIDAVASGKINLKGVVTNIFDFDDIQNAMDKSIADKANIVKAVVKIADETRL